MRTRGNASRVTSFRRSRVQPRGTNENLRASAGNRPRRAAGAQWAARPGRRQLEPSAWPCYVLERSYNKYRTGADIAETVLTPASVKSTANLFHKQFVIRWMATSKALLFMPPRSPWPAASTTPFMPPPCTTPSLPSIPIPARSFQYDGLALPSPDLI